MPQTTQHIGIVAGEASGDFLGSHLMKALQKRIPRVRFSGIGGPAMEAAGMDSWYPMERLAVRGYVEVLRHYTDIVSIRRNVTKRMCDEKPSVFIGIDAPDFNLSLEKKLKKNGIKTIHYVSPSVWAWRGGRIHSINQSIDRMLVLFPFEEELYRKAGIPVTYVGHPLADVIPESGQMAIAREQLRIKPKQIVVTLLPGSRQSELQYLARSFIRTAKVIHKNLEGVRFLVPLVSRETRAIFENALYEEDVTKLNITILFGHARDAIAAADAVLVASGTATLETALLGKPMVIAYRMSEISWRIMSKLRYQPWVGLPNIIAGGFIVPEFLQKDATPENMAQALLNSLRDSFVREALPERLREIHRLLRKNTAEKAADAVIQCMT